MKNINKLASMLKFLETRRCLSDCDCAKVHRGYLIMAISGHRIEASLGTTPDALRVNKEEFALIRYPFRCVEWRATWVTAAELYNAIIPSNLHVLMNSAVVSHTTHVLRSLFFVKELACFYEPQFSRNSPNISLSDYMLETKKKKTLGKSVKLNLPN